MGISDETRISELGIHCSRPNLDSGIFRVVQYRSSTRVGDREKAGMTVFTAVYKGRRNRLIQAFFTLPLFFFVYSVATCFTKGASSSGRSIGAFCTFQNVTVCFSLQQFFCPDSCSNRGPAWWGFA